MQGSCGPAGHARLPILAASHALPENPRPACFLTKQIPSCPPAPRPAGRMRSHGPGSGGGSDNAPTGHGASQRLPRAQLAQRNVEAIVRMGERDVRGQARAARCTSACKLTAGTVVWGRNECYLLM